jgi:hypothetical protein
MKPLRRDCAAISRRLRFNSGAIYRDYEAIEHVLRGATLLLRLHIDFEAIIKRFCSAFVQDAFQLRGNGKAISQQLCRGLRGDCALIAKQEKRSTIAYIALLLRSAFGASSGVFAAMTLPLINVFVSFLFHTLSICSALHCAVSCITRFLASPKSLCRSSASERSELSRCVSLLFDCNGEGVDEGSGDGMGLVWCRDRWVKWKGEKRK